MHSAAAVGPQQITIGKVALFLPLEPARCIASVRNTSACELRTAMQDESSNRPSTLDDDTLAFAQRVFQHARAGDVQDLAELLDAGLPPDLMNDKGDTLLMLASYHGHGDVA